MTLLQENLVSIIMPTYNCGHYIQKTIESVLQQTYKEWELLIIDDCSTDNTKEIVEKYVIDYEQIHYVCQDSNKGVAIARNKGMELAKGTYIAFLDSDDVWLPEKLEIQVDFMRKKKCSFSFMTYELIDEEGRLLHKIIRAPEKINYDTALYNTPIFTSSVMFMKENFKDYKFSYTGNGEDFTLWLKLLKQTDYAYGIDACLVNYRIRSGSLSRGLFVKLRRRWDILKNEENIRGTNLVFVYMRYLVCTLRKRRRNGSRNIDTYNL